MTTMVAFTIVFIFMRQLFGKPRNIWQIGKTASGIIGEHMLAIIESSARLFPRALDTLETLNNRGLVLVLISNCSEAYLNAHNKAFKLDRYFTM